MPATKIYKTEAIILKHANLREADRVITLYTPNLGKLRVVVKGARRTTSKLGGHVQPLTRCSLMLARGRNMDTLTQSQIIDSFPQIHDDLLLTAQALYLVELTDAFTFDQLENYQVYRLLLDSLHSLVEAPNAELLLRYFEVQLLGYVGYQPELYHCLTCKSALEPTQNFFSFSGGGVLCSECSYTEPIVRPLSVNALKVLRLLQRENYTTARRIRLKVDLGEELEQITQGYIQYLLERELKSTQFLKRLKRDESPALH
ncbi:MAG: DNA repair protein RecO [Dehalococcoidia bacterium]